MGREQLRSWGLLGGLCAALALVGCGRDDDQVIEQVEPSPPGAPSTDFGEVPPGGRPPSDLERTTPAAEDPQEVPIPTPGDPADTTDDFSPGIEQELEPETPETAPETTPEPEPEPEGDEPGNDDDPSI
ncbi:hypothetical protein BH23PLA1_BH23PLA1_23420 [soil metagenome]